ncbi:MAG: Protein kinase domain [Chloroflexi bacterium]|nr:Protein kinase domain [Chloroflexota bacterium]
MTRTEQRFHALSGGQSYTIAFDATPLGKGGQGRVHRISRIDRTQVYGAWVVKFLDDSSNALAFRLQALVDLLSAQSLNTQGLACLPVVLTSSSGLLSIVMRYAPGPDLAQSEAVPPGATLPKRLAATFELARSVRRLHAEDIVIGDLAHDNIIISPENWALYLVDVDGAGFTWKGRHYAESANNSSKGQFCPPEYVDSVPYSRQMDLWGLSVLIHFILTDRFPISMFNWEMVYAEPSGPSWPPATHAETAGHLRKLNQLGTPIRDGFLHAFNAGRKHAWKRLLAWQWEQLLAQAQQHMYQCWAPGCEGSEPFVALNDNSAVMYECPACGTPLVARP